jgi:hypothetical protein
VVLGRGSSNLLWEEAQSFIGEGRGWPVWLRLLPVPFPKRTFSVFSSWFCLQSYYIRKRFLSSEPISRIKICLSMPKKPQSDGNFYQKTEKIQFCFSFFSKWTSQEKNLTREGHQLFNRFWTENQWTIGNRRCWSQRTGAHNRSIWPIEYFQLFYKPSYAEKCGDSVGNKFTWNY